MAVRPPWVRGINTPIGGVVEDMSYSWVTKGDKIHLHLSWYDEPWFVSELRRRLRRANMEMVDRWEDDKTHEIWVPFSSYSESLAMNIFHLIAKALDWQRTPYGYRIILEE